MANIPWHRDQKTLTAHSLPQTLTAAAVSGPDAHSPEPLTADADSSLAVLSESEPGSDASRPAADEQLRTGESVGPYVLTRRIGRGGMGVVYEAVHGEIGQRCAIKLLLGHLARQPSYRERFLREAKVGSQIRHPGLVQPYGYGVLEDGTPYIQMEYVDGQSLRTRLRQQPDRRLPIHEALRLGRQIAWALSAAHAAGIVHRDLKPDNVMLVKGDEAAGGERARVLDFGVAKFIHAPDGGTMPAQVLCGTPSYMSPEQCRGDDDLGCKSDVYSLGVMLYQMLCGRTPFVRDRHDQGHIFYQHLVESPTPAHDLRPELAASASKLLTLMMAKDPALRPTMEKVAEDLGSLASAPGDSTYSAVIQNRLGTRIAAVVLVIFFLVILILWEVWFLPLHHEYWLPGRTPSMVLIPRTLFRMGATHSEEAANSRWAIEYKACKECKTDLYARELPAHYVVVSSFYMDTTEVTNQAYADWLNQKPSAFFDSAQSMAYAGPDWLVVIRSNTLPEAKVAGIELFNGKYRPRPGMEQQPVVMVSWEGAQRYCQSQGKRLPTEAEWELAARGAEGRRFPWGDDDPGCTDAIFNWEKSAMHCTRKVGEPAAVGSTPRDVTPLGVYDLAGNVSEWTLDFYRPNYQLCSEDLCIDPVVTTNLPGHETEGLRAVRGGAYSLEIDACRGAGRQQRIHNRMVGDIGFRCALPQMAKASR